MNIAIVDSDSVHIKNYINLMTDVLVHICMNVSYHAYMLKSSFIINGYSMKPSSFLPYYRSTNNNNIVTTIILLKLSSHVPCLIQHNCNNTLICPKFVLLPKIPISVLTFFKCCLIVFLVLLSNLLKFLTHL